jgi:ribosome-associated protein
MQVSNKQLLETLTGAIQEKKGSRIVIADFTNLENVIYKYFIICQGNTSTQVEAITREIGDQAREKLDEKPFAVSGLDNCIWVAMDYGDIIVHIFQPEARAFYDLEHLWADAKLTELPDEDTQQEMP